MPRPASYTKSLTALPVDLVLPDLSAALRRGPNAVLEAPPGAGKTTRVPPALLALGGHVLVLEPRRIAARMAARRVAFELGEQPGDTVGYQVRFEEVSSDATRIWFLTEGVLTRRLLTDRELHGVGTVILDEFHERHLDGDLALALLLHLQRGPRPELRILVMSATLDGARIAEHLGGCPVIRSEGRLFDLDVAYTPYSPAPLEQQVAAAIDRLPRGHDTLVFLPGAAEIRRSMDACQRNDVIKVALHGDLTPDEQDRAVRKADRPKVIFSTNVAESSITIDGVTAVIDSGLARVAADSPWTGIPSVNVARISQASATQRAGRAARTAPGRVIRLYTAEDFHRRPPHDTPELLRRELSQTLLTLRGIGIRDPRELPWLDAPPTAAIAAAEALLDRLGATGARANQMGRLPVHPRLARLILEAKDRGAGEAGCKAAALLSSGDRPGHPDLLHALDQPLAPRTRQIFDQLKRASNARGRGDDAALQIAVLAAFPDRLGRKRGNELRLASGGSAAFDIETKSDLHVALDIEERRERGLPVVRLSCPIEAEWLIDLFADRIREVNEPEWNRAAERVDQRSALLYDELVVEESRSGSVDPEAASHMLAAKAIEAGITRFVDADQLNALRARVNFAAAHAAIPPLDDEHLEAAVAAACLGQRSFAEIDGGRILAAVLDCLPAGGRRLLDEAAPERIKLSGGRSVAVNYVDGQPPWIESRLQDFFGMKDTPRVGRGSVPVVVHLLAPNKRPVQTTSDLAGFWQRLYPQVRKELSRRYPRHAWPEDPS